MPVTYKKIASVTVTGAGGAANIEFTSIPNTFDDLVLKVSTRTNRSGVTDDLKMTLNGASSGYSARMLNGDGSTVNSFTDASGAEFTYPFITNGNTATSSTFANGECYILNYKGTTNKSISFDSVSENNATSVGTRLSAGLLTLTSAITSIKLLPGSGSSILQYSTATLYGISKS